MTGPVFNQQTDPSDLRNVVYDLKQRIESLERSFVDVNRLDEIASEAGVLLRADGVAVDSYGSVMNLNSHAVTNGELLTDFLPIHTSILPLGGRIEVRMSGYIIQNSGATRTFWIAPSISKNGTSSFSPTSLRGSGSPSISLTGSATMRMWEYVLRITRANDLNPTRIILDETMTVEGTVKNATTLYECSGSISRLDEITHLAFATQSNESNPYFLIVANLISIQEFQEENAPFQRWLAISSDDPFDSYIRVNAPTNNFGSATTIAVGETNAGADTYRSLIKFPALDHLIAAYPDAVILEAILVMTLQGDQSSTDRTMRIYPILKSWTEAGVTWNTRDGSTAWSTAGLGSGTDRGADYLGYLAMSASEVVGRKFFATLIPSEIQKYFTGEYVNYGFLLQNETEANDMYSWHSANAAAVDTAPLLRIKFSVPG